MADRNDSKQAQALNHVNQEDPGAAGIDNDAGNIGGTPGSQHNDWGRSSAVGGASAQSDLQSELQSGQQSQQQSAQPVAASGNIGGVPGSQHNDWGHSPLAGDGSQHAGNGGNAQSAQSDAAQTPRQGVMPGYEMGHLQRGQKDGKQER